MKPPLLTHTLRTCVMMIGCLTLAACGSPPGPVTTPSRPLTFPSKAASTLQAIPTLPLPPTLTTAAPGSSGSLQVTSIYNENIPPTTAERIQINELELARDALRLLINTSWNGDKDVALPLSIEDFDASRLGAYVADERSDTQELTIPPDLAELYLSPEATREITDLLLQARNEYVAYLQAKGVLPQYSDEINRVVLPPDLARLIYHPENDPNAPPTATGPTSDAEGKRDYGRLQMDVYPVDIYNRALSFNEAKILGEEPTEAAAQLAYQRQLRDLALRQLVYHEMTHVLQRAYIHLHTPAKEHQSKSADVYADKTLDKVVDTRYHWQWGSHSTISELNNRHVSDESQAEGISFEVFADVHNLSLQQRAAVWDHLFGRLEQASAALDEIKTLCATHYPDLSMDEFGDPLAEVMAKYSDSEARLILTRVARRLSALPAYVGYLNPMQPADTAKFWAVLQQP
ncbi:MAG TPA: hypothetical protein VLG46_17530 [Anaerolineae bacterium]|nr:hypothetical protein [Anaerolineae bacterium]